MSRLDEYFAKANRGSHTTSSVSASGDKPASNMDAYFAKAGKPVRTNPLNLYTEALKDSQGQSTMQTPYADAAAQTKQSGTQNLYAQAAENAKKSGNAAKGTSVVFNSVYGKADDRASSAGSGKYAGILKASDYTELSKSGESKRKLFGDARYDYINNIGNFRAQSDVQQAQGRGQDYGKYAFMTDDEIGVYNYLYATQGKKAANAFLSDLEPELDKQWYTGTNRATTEALGKNAATRTLASAMTVAAQPMRMFVNAGDTVRRIAKATGSKSLEGYYFNAGAYSQRAGNWIAKGGARTDIDGHRIGASLADTLAPMRKNETKYRDFQLYLLHMHNVDRMKYDNSGELERIKENLRWVKEKYPELRELSNEELRRIANSDSDSPVVRQAAHEIYLAAHNGEAPSLTSVAEGAAYALELERQRAIVEKQGLKPVFGYDVTADDSQTAAQLLEAKNPEFKEWAKEVYRYSDDLIRYRVEAGLITPEFANALKKRYPHYIPTFREEGTNSKRARRARRNGGIVVSNAIGRAVGSDGVLLPLHTALSRKTVSTMRNAGLNQFGLALVREYDRNTKAAEKYIWNVAESEYTPTEAAIESDEDYKPVFENVFSVKDNGKAYDITMDEGLTAAMKAFEPDKLASYGAAKAMKKLNDLFKALCTGYNPFFMIRNGVRDWQDAGFYSTDWKTWEKMYWSAWNQIRKNGEIWQQYKALGGSYASMLDYTTGMVKEPKNALGKVAARYERLGQAIEAAPRLAEFMTILANKGGSKTVDGVKTGKFTQSDLMEAMLGAADITTNFARGGSVTKALNRYLVPFLNPSIQGFDKFIRNATETRSVKAAASLILKAALINLPPLLLNGLMHGDDDDWDDIPANTKANYYLINAGKLFGNGYWIKIPKGRAIAVLSTAAVYTQEKQKGEDVKFSDVFEVIKSNIAPTDIFNQNIATAWTQAKLTNPDNPGTTWYGGNIESDRLQNYRPEDRYAVKRSYAAGGGILPAGMQFHADRAQGL